MVQNAKRLNGPLSGSHVATVDYGVLDDLVGYAVRRAQLRVTEAFDSAFAETGLTTQRFSALVFITRNPGMKQSELAHLMGASAPQISLVLDALIHLRLAERRAVASDRRSHALYASAEGLARLESLERRAREHDQRVTAGLDATERRQLRALLNKVGPNPVST